MHAQESDAPLSVTGHDTARPFAAPAVLNRVIYTPFALPAIQDLVSSTSPIRFGEEASNYSPGNIIGVQVYPGERIFLNTEFHLIQAGYGSGISGVDVRSYGIGLHAGYDLLAAGRFSTYALAGASGYYNRVSIQENPGVLAGGVFSGTDEEVTLSNMHLMGDIGVGAGYAFTLVERSGSAPDLLLGIGLEGGYRAGLASSTWRWDGGTLDDGPDMAIPGPYLALALDLKFGGSSRREPGLGDGLFPFDNGMADDTIRMRYGIRAGYVAGWHGDPMTAWKLGNRVTALNRDGITAGGFAEYRLHRLVGVQGELLYAMKGGEVFEDLQYHLPSGSPDGAVSERRIMYEADYLDIPLLMNLHIPFGGTWSAHMSCGLYGSMLLSARRLVEEQYLMAMNTGPVTTFVRRSEEPIDLDRFDGGGAVGLGLGMKLGGSELSLDLRGLFGWGNVSNESYPIRNRTLGMTLGYTF